MHGTEFEAGDKPELLAHYRPLALKAVAAALALRRAEPTGPSIRDTEYSGPYFLDDDAGEPGPSFIR